MPIHEYKCEDCGKIFEDVTMNMESVKDSKKCPKCKGKAKKIVSPGSFIIHGYNANNGYAGHMR